MESLNSKKFKTLDDSTMASVNGGKWVLVDKKEITDGCTAEYYQQQYLFGAIKTDSTKVEYSDD